MEKMAGLTGLLGTVLISINHIHGFISQSQIWITILGYIFYIYIPNFDTKVPQKKHTQKTM